MAGNTRIATRDRRRIRRDLAYRLITVILVVSAAGPLAHGGSTESGTVTVLAAASLGQAFRAMATEFESRHPGTTVTTSFAGSPTLVRQIREGAPADVFAAADEASMARVAEFDGLAGAPRIFARNRLAIVVAAGNPEKIAGFADLARPGLTIALAAPGVPAGRYAREAFAKAGVVAPPSSQEADVKAVLQKVALGEADAGIVYVTDVSGESVEAVSLPDEFDVVARYPIAVLASARHPDAAREFVDFVSGPGGRAVLARFGFLAP